MTPGQAGWSFGTFAAQRKCTSTTTGQGYAGKATTRPLTLRVHLAAPPRVDVRGAVLLSDSLWSPDGKESVEVHVTSTVQPFEFEVIL